METEQIITELKHERERLTAAIDALEGTSHNRPSVRGRRHMSAEARARISRAMKLRWAQRKKKGTVHQMAKAS